jgi:O-antigen/teichoic acid export membrane protein
VLKTNKIINLGKMSRNALSNLLAAFAAMVVGFLLMPVVVEHIGIGAFGIWVLATSIGSYLGLLDAGLIQTLVKTSADLLARNDREELSSMVGTVFTLYLLLGLLSGALVISLSLVADRVFSVPAADASTLKIVILVVGLQIAFGFPMSIYRGLMSGLQDFHAMGAISILSNLLKFAMTILLLKSGFELLSLVLLGSGLAVTESIACMVWVRYRIPDLSLSLGFKYAKASGLARFSGSMFIWGIAARASQMDRIIIGLLLPVSSITTYEVGARVHEASRNLLYSVLTSVIPAASALSATHESGAIRELYLNGTKYLLLAYATIVLGIFLFGKQFLRLWMGNGFDESLWILYVLAIGSLYQSQSVMGHVMLVGTGRIRLFTKVMAIYPILGIVLNLILLPILGLIGAAFSSLVTCLVMESILVVHVKRAFEIGLTTLVKRCHLPALASVAPAAAVVYLLQTGFPVDSWPRLSIGIAIFVLLVLLWYYVFELVKRRHGLSTPAFRSE